MSKRERDPIAELLARGEREPWDAELQAHEARIAEATAAHDQAQAALRTAIDADAAAGDPARVRALVDEHGAEETTRQLVAASRDRAAAERAELATRIAVESLRAERAPLRDRVRRQCLDEILPLLLADFAEDWALVQQLVERTARRRKLIDQAAPLLGHFQPHELCPWPLSPTGPLIEAFRRVAVSRRLALPGIALPTPRPQPERVKVRVVRKFGPYQVGEIAGFTPEKAQAHLRAGRVERADGQQFRDPEREAKAAALKAIADLADDAWVSITPGAQFTIVIGGDRPVYNANEKRSIPVGALRWALEHGVPVVVHGVAKKPTWSVDHLTPHRGGVDAK